MLPRAQWRRPSGPRAHPAVPQSWTATRRRGRWPRGGGLPVRFPGSHFQCVVDTCAAASPVVRPAVRRRACPCVVRLALTHSTWPPAAWRAGRLAQRELFRHGSSSTSQVPYERTTPLIAAARGLPTVPARGTPSWRPGARLIRVPSLLSGHTFFLTRKRCRSYFPRPRSEKLFAARRKDDSTSEEVDRR